MGAGESQVLVRLRLLGASAMGREAGRATGGLRGIERQASRTDKRLASLRGGLVGAGGALATIGGAAATGGLYQAGKATIEFDRGMRNVNSIAQLSEASLAKLSKRVLKLGGKTAQQPTTLAEGLYDLVSSGFKANQSMKILSKSSRAATAGLTTTEVSTSAVAAVLNAYRLPARKAGLVSDQLFRTVDRGVISFEELAANVGDVLPFASSLGVGLDEVGASVATMTKAGISAPETMTRIKAAMTTMLKPGEAMSKTLKGMGYESGEALIRAKGFQGALDALAKTTGGSKQKLAALFPDVRGLGAALALTGKNSKVAQADVKGMGKAGGATSRALGQQARSISYQWNKLKAGATALGVEWAGKLVPGAIKLINAVGPLGRKVFPVVKSTAQQVLDALKPARPFLQNVLIPLFKGLGIGILGSVVGAFKVALPIVRVAATALGWLGQKLAPLRGVFQGVGMVIGWLVAGPVLKLLGTIPKLGVVFRVAAIPLRILGGVARAGVGALRLLGRGAALVGAAFVRAGAFVRRYVGFLGGLPGRVGRIAVNIVGSFVNGLAKLAGGARTKVMAGITAIRSVLSRAPGAMLSAGKTIGKAIIDGIVAAIKAAPGAVTAAIGSVVPGPLKSAVSKVTSIDLNPFAAGGVVRRPGLQIVGERGPEIARFPVGTRITSAADSRRAMANRAASPMRSVLQPLHVHLHLSGREIHREVFKVERALAEAT